ncbi:MAG: CDP-alcohol phosphatidyltransferase family protein [Pseudomonadota bacterium]
MGKMRSWDQRLGFRIAKGLARTPITPNQVSLFSLVLTLTGAAFFTSGEAVLLHWGAGLFVAGRFLDHVDGELARYSGHTSRFGYYLDYTVGAISYAALFLGLGVGFRESALGDWSIVLGLAGMTAALLAMALNIGIDRQNAEGAVGYPSFAGFELEDGIYLIAPITWLGGLLFFFTAAGIGAVCYLLWTFRCYLRGEPAKASGR